MSVSKQTQTPAGTPEQLLQTIEWQLAAQRSQREGTSRNRALILVVGLLFIVVAAGIALLVLDQMLADLRHTDAVAPTESAVVAGNN